MEPELHNEKCPDCGNELENDGSCGRCDYRDPELDDPELDDEDLPDDPEEY